MLRIVAHLITAFCSMFFIFLPSLYFFIFISPSPLTSTQLDFKIARALYPRLSFLYRLRVVTRMEESCHSPLSSSDDDDDDDIAGRKYISFSSLCRHSRDSPPIRTMKIISFNQNSLWTILSTQTKTCLIQVGDGDLGQVCLSQGKKTHFKLLEMDWTESLQKIANHGNDLSQVGFK